MTPASQIATRAANALGEQVWVAVPATREIHPLFLYCLYYAPLFVLMVSMPSRSTAMSLLLLVGFFAAWIVWFLRWNPFVIVTVTDSEVLVLRCVTFTSKQATGQILDRFPLDVLRSSGPPRRGYRPVILGYRRYWARSEYSPQVDWLTGTSSQVS